MGAVCAFSWLVFNSVSVLSLSEAEKVLLCVTDIQRRLRTTMGHSSCCAGRLVFSPIEGLLCARRHALGVLGLCLLLPKRPMCLLLRGLVFRDCVCAGRIHGLYYGIGLHWAWEGFEKCV